jgi:hypothetical protein
MSLRRGGVACQANRPPCHRIASSRRLSRSATVTFAVFAVLVGVPSGPLAEGQPLTTFETLDISWSGTFSATSDPVSSTQYPRGVPGDLTSVNITWSATATVTPQNFENALSGAVSSPPITLHYRQLGGSYTYNVDNEQCSAKLNAQPSWLSLPGNGAQVTWHADTDRYEVYAQTPFTSQTLTTGLPGTNPCEAFAYWTEPPSTDTTFYRTFSQDDMAPPGGPYNYDRPLVSWVDPKEDFTTDKVSTDLAANSDVCEKLYGQLHFLQTEFAKAFATPDPPELLAAKNRAQDAEKASQQKVQMAQQRVAEARSAYGRDSSGPNGQALMEAQMALKDVQSALADAEVGLNNANVAIHNDARQQKMRLGQQQEDKVKQELKDNNCPPEPKSVA